MTTVLGILVIVANAVAITAVVGAAVGYVDLPAPIAFVFLAVEMIAVGIVVGRVLG